MERSMFAKWRIRAKAFAVLWLAGVGAAYAWDGVVSGVVSSVEITDGNTLGFRVFLGGVSDMCGNGLNWAYLNESDSNYKTYVAAILAAKAQGSHITVLSTIQSGYCHIGYISVQ